MSLRQDKIKELCSQWGYDDPFDFAQEVVADSICPCICKNPDCDYTTEAEPDATAAWCEECEEGSCKSLLILMCVI